jgi:hypothetical protein
MFDSLAEGPLPNQVIKGLKKGWVMKALFLIV